MIYNPYEINISNRNMRADELIKKLILPILLAIGILFKIVNY